MLLILRGGTVFQTGSVPSNLNFPFHQDNHSFAVVPLNRSRKRQGEGMCAGRYDCTVLSSRHSFVEHLEEIILLHLRPSAGLRGSCWETGHLVSSLEVHFED